MTMRNNIICFVIVTSIIFGVFLYKPDILHGTCIQHEYKESITVQENLIKVKRVRDDSTRTLGLSGACPLESGTGMLFEFETEGSYGFWMKDMEYALDMIWLDGDMKIVDTKVNVKPDTFPTVFYPQAPAKYVLELKAGSIDELGLKNRTDFDGGIK